MKSLPICHALKSSYYESRKHTIDTIVIHSMYIPDTEKELCAENCKYLLDEYEVSSHYLIDLQGKIWGLVDESNKAWHAGISKMPYDDRENVNEFSIGIELLYPENSTANQAQMTSLLELVDDLSNRHIIQYILGHQHIAPDRKTDPWNFNWKKFQQKFQQKYNKPEITFP